MSSPLIEIIIEGDMMTVKNTTILLKLENSFKVGEEYEEKMPRNTLKVVFDSSTFILLHFIVMQ